MYVALKHLFKTLCCSTYFLLLFFWQAGSPLIFFQSNCVYLIFFTVITFDWNPSISCPNFSKYWLNLRVIITWKNPISCFSLQRLFVCFLLSVDEACFHKITATTGGNIRKDLLVCSADILLDDSYEGNLRKEGRSVRIVVNISRGPKTTKVSISYCRFAFYAQWISSDLE